MRWKNRRRSNNIEDRRGINTTNRLSGASGAPALLLRFLPILLRSKGGRIILFIGAGILVAGHFFGINLGTFNTLSPTGRTHPTESKSYHASQEEKELVNFVATVLADTETTWHALFQNLNQNYREPKLVLFTNNVQSACGFAQAAMGPFYCGADLKVYIDLSFYDDLKKRYGAAGDFAQAYVIAHEVGHHVQQLLGISQKVRTAKSKTSSTAANQLSVRQELQADCFAGIWANKADKVRNLLEEGDLKEALTAAAAIGDDRLQKKARGYITPDSFTHGSSEQRVLWFQRGFQHGNIESCDTFSATAL